MESLAIVATCVVVIIIIVNAVFLQSGSFSSLKRGRATGNAQEIRKFLSGENRDIQRAISRVQTIVGGKAAQNQR